MVNMPLYAINAELDALIENCVDPETGEVVADLEERLNELTLARAEKVENVALVIKNYLAEAKMVEEAEKKFKARRIALQNKAERLKNYLAYCLGGEKYKSPMVNIYYTHTEAVAVSDAFFDTESNRKFFRVIPPEADKNAIKAAIKAGETITGAELVENTSMVLR